MFNDAFHRPFGEGSSSDRSYDGDPVELYTKSYEVTDLSEIDPNEKSPKYVAKVIELLNEKLANNDEISHDINFLFNEEFRDTASIYIEYFLISFVGQKFDLFKFFDVIVECSNQGGYPNVRFFLEEVVCEYFTATTISFSGSKPKFKNLIEKLVDYFSKINDENFSIDLLIEQLIKLSSKDSYPFDDSVFLQDFILQSLTLILEHPHVDKEKCIAVARESLENSEMTTEQAKPLHRLLNNSDTLFHIGDMEEWLAQRKDQISSVTRRKKVDHKAFAHICCGAIIRGEDELEGYEQAKMTELFYFLYCKAVEQISVSVDDGFKAYLQSLLHWSRELRQVRSKKDIEKLRSISQDVLDELNRSGFVVLPGGWTPSGEIPHAINYLFSIQDDGNYRMVVFNTGKGSQFHLTINEANKIKHVPWVIVKNIPRRELSKFKIEYLLHIRTRSPNSDYNYDENQVYRTFIPSLGGSICDHSDITIDDFDQVQKSGTCSWSSIKALMHYFYRNSENYQWKAIKHEMVMCAVHLYKNGRRNYRTDLLSHGIRSCLSNLQKLLSLEGISLKKFLVDKKILEDWYADVSNHPSKTVGRASSASSASFVKFEVPNIIDRERAAHSSASAAGSSDEMQAHRSMEVEETDITHTPLYSYDRNLGEHLVDLANCLVNINTSKLNSSPFFVTHILKSLPFLGDELNLPDSESCLKALKHLAFVTVKCNYTFGTRHLLNFYLYFLTDQIFRIYLIRLKELTLSDEDSFSEEVLSDFKSQLSEYRIGLIDPFGDIEQNVDIPLIDTVEECLMAEKILLYQETLGKKTLFTEGNNTATLDFSEKSTECKFADFLLDSFGYGEEVEEDENKYSHFYTCKFPGRNRIGLNRFLSGVEYWLYAFFAFDVHYSGPEDEFLQIFSKDSNNLIKLAKDREFDADDLKIISKIDVKSNHLHYYSVNTEKHGKIRAKNFSEQFTNSAHPEKMSFNEYSTNENDLIKCHFVSTTEVKTITDYSLSVRFHDGKSNSRIRSVLQFYIENTELLFEERGRKELPYQTNENNFNHFCFLKLGIFGFIPSWKKNFLQYELDAKLSLDVLEDFSTIIRQVKECMVKGRRDNMEVTKTLNSFLDIKDKAITFYRIYDESIPSNYDEVYDWIFQCVKSLNIDLLESIILTICSRIEKNEVWDDNNLLLRTIALIIKSPIGSVLTIPYRTPFDLPAEGPGTEELTTLLERMFDESNSLDLKVLPFISQPVYKMLIGLFGEIPFEVAKDDSDKIIFRSRCGNFLVQKVVKDNRTANEIYWSFRTNFEGLKSMIEQKSPEEFRSLFNKPSDFRELLEGKEYEIRTNIQVWYGIVRTYSIVCTPITKEKIDSLRFVFWEEGTERLYISTKGDSYYHHWCLSTNSYFKKNISFHKNKLYNLEKLTTMFSQFSSYHGFHVDKDTRFLKKIVSERQSQNFDVVEVGRYERLKSIHYPGYTLHTSDFQYEHFSKKCNHMLLKHDRNSSALVHIFRPSSRAQKGEYCFEVKDDGFLYGKSQNESAVLACEYFKGGSTERCFQELQTLNKTHSFSETTILELNEIISSKLGKNGNRFSPDNIALQFYTAFVLIQNDEYYEKLLCEKNIYHKYSAVETERSRLLHKLFDNTAQNSDVINQYFRFYSSFDSDLKLGNVELSLFQFRLQKLMRKEMAGWRAGYQMKSCDYTAALDSFLKKNKETAKAEEGWQELPALGDVRYSRNSRQTAGYERRLKNLSEKFEDNERSSIDPRNFWVYRRQMNHKEKLTAIAYVYNEFIGHFLGEEPIGLSNNLSKSDLILLIEQLCSQFSSYRDKPQRQLVMGLLFLISQGKELNLDGILSKVELGEGCTFKGSEIKTLISSLLKNLSEWDLNGFQRDFSPLIREYYNIHEIYQRKERKICRVARSLHYLSYNQNDRTSRKVDIRAKLVKSITGESGINWKKRELNDLPEITLEIGRGENSANLFPEILYEYFSATVDMGCSNEDSTYENMLEAVGREVLQYPSSRELCNRLVESMRAAAGETVTSYSLKNGFTLEDVYREIVKAVQNNTQDLQVYKTIIENCINGSNFCDDEAFSVHALILSAVNDIGHLTGRSKKISIDEVCEWCFFDDHSFTKVEKADYLKPIRSYLLLSVINTALKNILTLYPTLEEFSVLSEQRVGQLLDKRYFDFDDQRTSDIVLYHTYKTGLIMREEQALLTEQRHDADKVALQGVCGLGKTSYLAPLWSVLDSVPNENLVIFVVPKFNLITNQKDLVKYFTKIYSKDTYIFTFDRGVDCSEEVIKHRYMKLESAKRNGDIVICSDYDLKSLLLKYIELLTELYDGKLIRPTSVKYIGQMIQMIQNSFIIADELDSLCDNSTYLNFTKDGKGLEIEEKRYKLPLKIFEVLLEQTQIGTVLHEENPHIDFSEYKDNAIPTVIDELLSCPRNYIKDPEAIKDEIFVNEVKDYLSASENLEPSVKDRFSQWFERNKGKLNTDNLLLTRAHLHLYLPLCLGMVFYTDYGPKAGSTLSSPYLSNMKPSNSKFSRVDILVILTIMMYLKRRLDFKSLESVIKTEKKQLEFFGYDQDVKTEVAAAFAEITGNDLGSCSDKEVDELLILFQSNLAKSKAIIISHLKNNVLPHIRQNVERFSATAQDLVNTLCNELVGFSGSINNFKTYTSELEVKFSETADGKFLTEFFDDNIFTIKTLRAGETWKETISDSNISAFADPTSAHTGVDTLSIADQIFSHRDDLTRVILSDPKSNEWISYYRSKTSKPYVAGEVLDSSAFTYYDQYHTIGADIKNHEQAVMTLFVDTNPQSKMTFSSLVQTAGRMRGRGKDGQKISLVLTSRLAEEINSKINGGYPLKLKFLLWLISNEGSKIDTILPTAMVNDGVCTFRKHALNQVFQVTNSLDTANGNNVSMQNRHQIARLYFYFKDLLVDKVEQKAYLEEGIVRNLPSVSHRVYQLTLGRFRRLCQINNTYKWEQFKDSIRRFAKHAQKLKWNQSSSTDKSYLTDTSVEIDQNKNCEQERSTQFHRLTQMAMSAFAQLGTSKELEWDPEQVFLAHDFISILSGRSKQTTICGLPLLQANGQVPIVGELFGHNIYVTKNFNDIFGGSLFSDQDSRSMIQSKRDLLATVYKIPEYIVEVKVPASEGSSASGEQHVEETFMILMSSTEIQNVRHWLISKNNEVVNVDYNIIIRSPTSGKVLNSLHPCENGLSHDHMPMLFLTMPRKLSAEPAEKMLDWLVTRKDVDSTKYMYQKMWKLRANSSILNAPFELTRIGQIFTTAKNQTKNQRLSTKRSYRAAFGNDGDGSPLKRRC